MFRLVIHGGAGLKSPDSLGNQRESAARKALTRALEAGSAILANGGTSMDAVLAAVSSMEDDPVFNAGLGAVLASDGKCYFDASIMNGATRNAGSICATPKIRHPIQLAEKVLHSPFVLLTGASALELAEKEGLECKEEHWFRTKYREGQLKRAIEAKTMILDHESAVDGIPNNASKSTVGAVALDIFGNVASATSTGGMCNKPPGRIGDTALIGAGTYADNKTCAVSTTGHGEIFIQWNVASRLSAMMEFGSKTLQEASQILVWKELPNESGGLIAVDNRGNIAVPFNTGGMFHGWIFEDQIPQIRIWSDEE